MIRSIPDNVQQFVTRPSARRRRLAAIVRTNRFTLVGAFFFAFFIPELFHPLVTERARWAGPLISSELFLYAWMFALLGGHIYLRKVGLLPLVDDKVLIIPAFATSYVVVAVFLRITVGWFGYYHLVTSFVMAVAWYFLVAFMRIRTSDPRLAYVGPLNMDDDLSSVGVTWVRLPDGNLPQDIQGIVFDSRSDLSPARERLFARAVLRGIPIYEISAIREMTTGRVQLRRRPEEVFGQILPEQPYLRIKRLLDLLLAIPALLIAAPVIGLFAGMIRLESLGPAIFRQNRIGFGGRKFKCYKLRSMRMGVPGPDYTTDHDPRITRVGGFIRKTRIDELPQIWNVLIGDMSWIGPRPESVPLARAYQRELPYYTYRHLVRPSISGWAAVHQGNVALADEARLKLEYDFYYIKNFSPWLDILIVLMTIRTVLTGMGSR